jgi:hypothetical protein
MIQKGQLADRMRRFISGLGGHDYRPLCDVRAQFSFPQT